MSAETATLDMARWRRGTTQLLAGGGGRWLGTLAGLALIWIGFGLASEQFLTEANISNVFLQASSVACLAAGMTVALIAAEIDVSVSSIQVLAGTIAATIIITSGLPVVVGVALALLAATVVGALNGVLTTRLAIPSFIVTLAMLGIAQGAAFLITDGIGIRGFPDAFRAVGVGKVGAVPTAALVAAGVFVALHLMLTRTRLGRHIHATGGGPEAALLAGVRVARVKVIALAISGLTAGIGGLILSARLNAADGRFGEPDLLIAVAAVVIGGTSLSGGVGSVLGTAVGVVMIVSIKNGLVLMNVQDFWQRIAVGVIIILAMAVDQFAKRRTES